MHSGCRRLAGAQPLQGATRPAGARQSVRHLSCARGPASAALSWKTARRSVRCWRVCWPCGWQAWQTGWPWHCPRARPARRAAAPPFAARPPGSTSAPHAPPQRLPLAAAQEQGLWVQPQGVCRRPSSTPGASRRVLHPLPAAHSTCRRTCAQLACVRAWDSPSCSRARSSSSSDSIAWRSASQAACACRSSPSCACGAGVPGCQGEGWLSGRHSAAQRQESQWG